MFWFYICQHPEGHVQPPSPPPCTPTSAAPGIQWLLRKTTFPNGKFHRPEYRSLYFSAPQLCWVCVLSQAKQSLTQLNSTKMHSKFLLKTLLLQNVSYLKFIYSEKVTKIDSTLLSCTQISYSKLCCYKMYRT